MSVIITYKPNDVGLVTAADADQEYSLTLKNESSQDWVFYVYQTMPNMSEKMLSLAWFASPYPIAPQDEIEFRWSIQYNFVWGDTGELKPGINYNARGPRNANLDSLNLTNFGFNEGGAPTLSEPQKDSKNKGTLVINDQDNIPSKKFSVGIGMSGKGTFVEQAGPDLHHFFTPNPTYWIGAATKRKIGDVLDIKTITDSAKVEFQTGIYDVTKTLNSTNKWV